MMCFSIYIWPLQPAKAHEGHEEPHVRIKYLVGPNNPTTIASGLRQFFAEHPDLRDLVTVDVKTTADLEAENYTEEEFVKSDAVIIDIMSVRIQTDVQAGFPSKIIQAARRSGGRIFAVNQTTGLDDEYAAMGIWYDPTLRQYWDYEGAENRKNMVAYLLRKYFGYHDLAPVDPAPPLQTGYFHRHAQGDLATAHFDTYLAWYKEKGLYKEGAPWAAVLTFRSSFYSYNSACEDSFIASLEGRGFNVFGGFGYPEAKAAEALLIDAAGKPRVSAGVISFIFRFSDFNTTEVLSKVGVPVFDAIVAHHPHRPGGPKGLSPFEVAWQIAVPEIAGAIVPMMVGQQVAKRDPEFGFDILYRTPMPDRMQRMVDRFVAWHRLQTTPNAEKRVAFMYWNYPPGKEKIGASYLNVFESIQNVMRGMRDAGYAVGDRKPAAEMLLKNALAYGRNVGRWAPGELDAMIRNGDAVLWPVAEYQKYFLQLPDTFQARVLKTWGPADKTDIMVVNDPKSGERSFAIPAARYGNVALLPQPTRGWEQNYEKMIHDKELAPPHQYAAAYLWIKHVFGAHALIHTGTHGTQEWLPGAEVGLLGEDDPEIMAQDLPIIYPYIVDDVGEGIVAKRRGAAVVIDHMVPPLQKGGLYKEYAELFEMISDHDVALQKNPQLAQQYLSATADKVRHMGIAKDLRIEHRMDTRPDAPDSTAFNHDVLHEVEEYLKELKSTNTPTGLHTMGDAPRDTLMTSTVEAILEVESGLTGDARVARGRTHEENIKKGARREISNTLAALSGRYISTGTGNDPVRNPESLPTGKNFFAFNPQKIPKKAAWVLGQRLTDELIAEYREKHGGAYPEKLAFVLWGTETIRHEGVMQSQILYLLGVRPVWNDWGKIEGIELIQREQLGRPRIDIVISGSAHEWFAELERHIDRAVQMVEQLDEPDNFVRKHYLETRAELIRRGVEPALAGRFAGVRIFDEPPGRYDLNVSRMAKASGAWESDSVVAEEYLRRMSHGYGHGFWGEPMGEVYRMTLKGTSTVVHSRSTAIYGTLDNDDFFMYAGGLTRAIQELDGKSPDLQVMNLMDPSKPRMDSIDRVMGIEMKSRYLNPKWIAGMKAEGYEGAARMGDFVENLWGWQVVKRDVVDEAKWREVYEVYVKDKYNLDMKKFFVKKNPWAYQSITARMLEAIRKEYWKPGDPEVAKTLAREYVTSVLESGLACSEHVCNNPLLDKLVEATLTVPGLPAPEIVQKFTQIQQVARGKTRERAAQEMQKIAAAWAAEKPVQKVARRQSEVVAGYEMEEEIKKPSKDQPSFGSGGRTWGATFVVLGVLGLAVYGAWRGRKAA